MRIRLSIRLRIRLRMGLRTGLRIRLRIRLRMGLRMRCRHLLCGPYLRAGLDHRAIDDEFLGGRLVPAEKIQLPHLCDVILICLVSHLSTPAVSSAGST